MNAPLFDLTLVQKHKKRAHAASMAQIHEALGSEELITDILTDSLRSFPSACISYAGGEKPALPLAGHYGIESLHLHDELSLPHSQESSPCFDLIISYFTLHWHNDVLQTLKHYNQLLKPNGLFIGLFFGGYSLKELRQSLLHAETELTQQAAPRVSPTIDVKDAGRLIQQSGFENPVSDLTRTVVSYDHPLTLMKDLKHLGETNALIQRPRRFMSKALLQHTCTTYADSFKDSEGRIQATVDIVTMTGWKPRNSLIPSLAAIPLSYE